MELSLSPDEYDNLDFEKVKSRSEKYGVGIWTLHLPFYPFDRIDASARDEHVRASTVAYDSALIEKASKIGIERFVIHPSGEPVYDDEREERLAYVGETLAHLAAKADECGAKILVEDLPRTCLGHNSAEIEKILSYDQRLRVVFDTNHLLSEDPLDFIARVGDKIESLHVSDYDFIDEKHWLPGEGELEWASLISALDKAGYWNRTNVLMYEVMPENNNHCIRSRRLTCEDYVQNAHELFEGKKLTVF